MSKKCWGAEDYGLYVTEEDLREYADKNNLDVSDVGYEHFNAYSEAEGECYLIIGDSSESFDADDSFFIGELSRFPTLFRAAYKDEAEALSELKEVYGEFLPDDFDYKGKFIRFVGTTFG